MKLVFFQNQNGGGGSSTSMEPDPAMDPNNISPPAK